MMVVKCLTCGNQTTSYYEMPCVMCIHNDVKRTDRWSKMVVINDIGKIPQR